MIVLKTGRVLLRPFKESDFDSLKSMMTNEKVMAFTGYRSAQSEQMIKKELSRWIKETSNEIFYWCAESIQQKNFIGWFMLKKTIASFYEIGFMLAENSWNQGFATEISKEILKFAKNVLKEEKVIASTRVENKASIKVIEKLGMKVSGDYITEEDTVYYEKTL